MDSEKKQIPPGVFCFFATWILDSIYSLLFLCIYMCTFGYDMCVFL